MSEPSFYEKLGVTENASFDEIQEARNHLIEQHSGDQKLIESIESAYDAILMERLKMRQEGKIKVPERIRFPEKATAPQPSFAPIPAKNSPLWLQNLVDRPSLRDLLWPSGWFSILSLLVFLYPSPDQSKLSLALAVGLGLTLFWVNRKENKFGRAILLTLGGLFLGVGLGY